jgi:enediyne biosynthesis protein E4
MIECRAKQLRGYHIPILATVVFALLAGCGASQPPVLPTQPQAVAVQVTALPLAPIESCTDTFTPYLLDHTTVTSTKLVDLYESNGAGVAINDLDNDGDLDIALANLGAPNTLLWNEGDLKFRTQSLGQGAARAVNSVDVEGDGWPDLVFTQRLAKPSYWRNTGQAGEQRFGAGVLAEVNNPLYSMDWGDLDQDGDLDLVAGSYDTELRKEKGAIFDYQGGGVGVFVYTQQAGVFIGERLAEAADALTIALPDLNGDRWLDILVGNDFDRPDYAWLRVDNGWQAATPFQRTSENTMSFDLGDIDNNGSTEIFATDMKPYQQNVATLAQWLPMMDKMTHPTTSGDPQRTENVLQVRGADSRYRNQGYNRLLDATGWSWSSKFGDLDNDGFLDIYVVNGMIAAGLFSHLPNNELVEENVALRNDGTGHFTPTPEWGLGSTASGRGMSMGDLDSDGDLDIVINNLGSPAQLFENQLCGGQGLLVDLRWPESRNPFAIGAQLTLHTSAGAYYRTLRAASGYLSGDPTRVHFGLPTTTTIQQLAVRWPDGAASTIEPITPQTLVTVTR